MKKINPILDLTDFENKGLKQELKFGQINPDMNLQKPIVVLNQNYTLDIDNPTAIKAIGYGCDHRDHPLALMEFERRAPRDDDIVIEILYCGVCGSCWHVYKNEWKNTKYPIIAGHEIVGTVVKVGPAVKKFKVGNYAAVGPNYDSCRQCTMCKKNMEQYCENDVTEVYNMPDRKPGELKPTGPITQGGYSNVIVVNERYALKIKDNIPVEFLPRIAPLLCAGITMYTPLKELKIGTGSRVGIVGCGGLGHIGVKLAAMTGAEVVAFSRTQVNSPIF